MLSDLWRPLFFALRRLRLLLTCPSIYRLHTGACAHSLFPCSNGEVFVPSSLTRLITSLLKSFRQVRSNDWYVVGEASDGLEEFTE